MILCVVAPLPPFCEKNEPERLSNTFPACNSTSHQEIRDEDAEWTDYDSDELVVKFRIADSIFDSLIRETVSVFSAIENK